MVTVPELLVAPAAMVSVVPVWEKSAATAGAFGVAETVSVTVALLFPVSEAVTVLEPAFSEMEDELSARVTVGVDSSSVRVRVCDAGAATP